MFLLVYRVISVSGMHAMLSQEAVAGKLRSLTSGSQSVRKTSEWLLAEMTSTKRASVAARTWSKCVHAAGSSQKLLLVRVCHETLSCTDQSHAPNYFILNAFFGVLKDVLRSVGMFCTASDRVEIGKLLAQWKAQKIYTTSFCDALERQIKDGVARARHRSPASESGSCNTRRLEPALNLTKAYVKGMNATIADSETNQTEGGGDARVQAAALVSCLDGRTDDDGFRSQDAILGRYIAEFELELKDIAAVLVILERLSLVLRRLGSEKQASVDTLEARRGRISAMLRARRTTTPREAARRTGLKRARGDDKCGHKRQKVCAGQPGQTKRSEVVHYSRTDRAVRFV